IAWAKFVVVLQTKALTPASQRETVGVLLSIRLLITIWSSLNPIKSRLNPASICLLLISMEPEVRE
ncbi:MAG: hypothetical protein JZU67_03770, partial [Burkholderiaceae bacterium]|nr:hypothetical protein [Burkholderiaceae bacterium]